MTAASTIQAAVYRTLREIQEKSNKRRVELDDGLNLVHDLGFASLDLAQLVAILEMELDFDPFSEGASIEELKTVGDVCRVYGGAAG
ncbi:hypothetical protein [Methylomagnum sp.]